MEECLDYFRRALEQPGSVPPWADWWATHAELARQVFDRLDYVRLKHRWLNGARELLERLGTPAVEPQMNWLDRTVCPKCGERLLKFVPGADPSYEERFAFVQRSGFNTDPDKVWRHHGVYCPRECIAVLIEFRTPERDAMWAQFDAEYKGRVSDGNPGA
jgi:hypothetical protein